MPRGILAWPTGISVSLIPCRFPRPLGTIQDLPAYDVKQSLRATPNTPALEERSDDYYSHSPVSFPAQTIRSASASTCYEANSGSLVL